MKIVTEILKIRVHFSFSMWHSYHLVWCLNDCYSQYCRSLNFLAPLNWADLNENQIVYFDMVHQLILSLAVTVAVLIDPLYHPTIQMIRLQIYIQIKNLEKQIWIYVYSFLFLFFENSFDSPEFPLLSPIQHVLSFFKIFAFVAFKSLLLLSFEPSPKCRFCTGNFFLKPNDIAVPLVSTDRERFLLSVWPWNKKLTYTHKLR